MVQLQIQIFEPTVIEAAFLEADSPRKAFYLLKLEASWMGFTVIKESGFKGKICDRRTWPAASMDDAEKIFKRKLRAKLNPNRKGPRIYKLGAIGR